MTLSRLLVLPLFLGLLAVGCTTETITTTGSDKAATAPAPADVPLVDASLLGEFCSNVGTSDGQVLAFDAVKDCAKGTGVCVADGRRKVLLGGAETIDTYCSASCENAACPEAWECVDNIVNSDTAPKKVCVKQAAVCGDGVKQLDEACEDGNASGKDGCSADCKKVLPAGINVRSMSGYVIEQGTHESPLSKSFYITHFPELDDASSTFGEGNIEKVTSEQLTVKLGVIDSVTYKGYRLTTVIPRAVGKVASPGGVQGSWSSYGNIVPTAPVQLEVLSVTTDGRAYEVTAHIEGHLEPIALPPGLTNPLVDAVIVIDATFVVTVP